MEKSAIISSEIFSAHIEAEQAISALREKCYKLAGAYFDDASKDQQKAAYALADKYQRVLEVLGELDGAATAIRDGAGVTLPDDDPWGDKHDAE